LAVWSLKTACFRAETGEKLKIRVFSILLTNTESPQISRD
jgi:hypothetical protein